MALRDKNGRMRASDFDILIVPSIGGAAEGDWPSRWRSKLSTARFVHPADPRERRRQAWIEAVAGAAREATRPALFVGHGIGAAAVADAGAALKGADVRGAFLVAPPDEKGLVRLVGADWTPTRMPLPWPSVVIASRNDPYAAYDAVAALASDWGADLIDAGQAGGLDAASGHGPWPEGLMRLAAFIKGIGARRAGA
jgi:predicted alpha/beta hydrolase family esterase